MMPWIAVTVSWYHYSAFIRRIVEKEQYKSLFKTIFYIKGILQSLVVLWFLSWNDDSTVVRVAVQLYEIKCSLL